MGTGRIVLRLTMATEAILHLAHTTPRHSAIIPHLVLTLQHLGRTPARRDPILLHVPTRLHTAPVPVVDTTAEAVRVEAIMAAVVEVVTSAEVVAVRTVAEAVITN
jgi:hypothetical protein